MEDDDKLCYCRKNEFFFFTRSYFFSVKCEMNRVINDIGNDIFLNSSKKNAFPQYLCRDNHEFLCNNNSNYVIGITHKGNIIYYHQYRGCRFGVVVPVLGFRV